MSSPVVSSVPDPASMPLIPRLANTSTMPWAAGEVSVTTWFAGSSAATTKGVALTLSDALSLATAVTLPMVLVVFSSVEMAGNFLA